MFKSLWIKFLILLFSVTMISLTAALFLRELMIKDYREYLEGEMENRVYWITADLEGTYEKYSGWNEDIIAGDAIRALLMGFEIQILDLNGTVVMDTEKAITNLTPLMKKRVIALSDFKQENRNSKFLPYPLFLGGKEIGSLEVKVMVPSEEGVFIERSNRFLLVSLFTLGGLAFLLSVFFSKTLTKPLKSLTSAAKAISKGNLKGRVEISGRDEISKLSETFNIMAHTLETQESLRKKLTSNIAHEMRTPLSAMRGELEGMMDGLIPVNKEQLQSLFEETGRLKNILEGIEELSQAEASSLFLKKQLVKFKPFLKDILERFGRLFTDKGIVTDFQCDDNLIIDADPDRLSQIVINLLSNALKVTERGDIIWIKAYRDRTGVFLEVSDNGRGIEEKDLPFIFERFYRVEGGGLGLGLTIVKELVEAHGGRIEVKSEYGKGSTFTVFIPFGDLHNFS